MLFFANLNELLCMIIISAKKDRNPSQAFFCWTFSLLLWARNQTPGHLWFFMNRPNFMKLKLMKIRDFNQIESFWPISSSPLRSRKIWGYLFFSLFFSADFLSVFFFEKKNVFLIIFFKSKAILFEKKTAMQLSSSHLKCPLEAHQTIAQGFTEPPPGLGRGLDCSTPNLASGIPMDPGCLWFAARAM